MFQKIINDITNLNLYSFQDKYLHNKEYNNEYLSIKNKYGKIFDRRLNLENKKVSISNEYKRDNDKTKYTINLESVRKEEKELNQTFDIIRKDYVLKNKERIIKNNFLVNCRCLSLTLTKNEKNFDNELLFFLKNNLLYNIFDNNDRWPNIRITDYTRYIEYLMLKTGFINDYLIDFRNIFINLVNNLELNNENMKKEIYNKLKNELNRSIKNDINKLELNNEGKLNQIYIKFFKLLEDNQIKSYGEITKEIYNKLKNEFNRSISNDINKLKLNNEDIEKEIYNKLKNEFNRSISNDINKLKLNNEDIEKEIYNKLDEIYINFKKLLEDYEIKNDENTKNINKKMDYLLTNYNKNNKSNNIENKFKVQLLVIFFIIIIYLLIINTKLLFINYFQIDNKNNFLQISK